MVVYNVFSSCVYYNYKAYICSKATIVLFLLSILTVFFPLLFTWKSPGFWLKTDTYQEQPKVNFIYDYIIFFDVLNPPGKKPAERMPVYLCSNIESLLYMSNNYYYCPFIKAYEEDLNGDGFNDLLKFETKLFVPPNSDVKGINIMLFFDFKLSSYCRAQFQGAAYIHHSSPVPGAGFMATGDLTFVQRQPLNPRRLDTRYNKTIVQHNLDEKTMGMGEILQEYALRNLSTKLTNVYASWLSRRVNTEPFTVEVTVTYPEVTVRYTPTTWQVLRLGWAQFFPVFIVFVYMFKCIKDFIFSNQLVTTYREEPWSKGH